MAKLRQAHDTSISSSACSLKGLGLSYLNSFNVLFPPWLSFNFRAGGPKLSRHLKKKKHGNKKVTKGHELNNQKGLKTNGKIITWGGGGFFKKDIVNVY